MFKIKLGGGGRKQILCDDNGGFRKSSVVLSLTTQGNDDALRHVFNIRAASAQVIVFNFGINCEQAICRNFDSPLGVDSLFKYVFLHIVEKLAVFEHEHVRVEDVSV